jgi:hypothetical protein
VADATIHAPSPLYFHEHSHLWTATTKGISMSRTVSEPEFDCAIRAMLADLEGIGSVTGPGRSGALAAVYASHILGVAFIPYGTMGEAVYVDWCTGGETCNDCQTCGSCNWAT